MGWFIIWFALCVVTAMIANGKGRSPVGFFMLAFFLSPLVGLICAIAFPPIIKKVDVPDAIELPDKKCPACAEYVKYEAKKCKHCGELFVSRPIPSYRS